MPSGKNLKGTEETQQLKTKSQSSKYLAHKWIQHVVEEGQQNKEYKDEHQSHQHSYMCQQGIPDKKKEKNNSKKGMFFRWNVQHNGQTEK